ncbi:MAG: hypothetical protein D6808_07900 [Candidatus Dadabacteria bacterium]|nr:MAG: hypothetical protein D6808_07900 [Candidatus Dadabacteria bacterium]
MAGNLLRKYKERLVIRYCDGESGPLGAFLAKRLISRDRDIREFSQSLKRISEEVKVWGDSKFRMLSTDLVSRIERRIDEEEKAALFLGERKALPTGLSGGWFGVDRIGRIFRESAAGLISGAVAAVVTFFALNLYSPSVSVKGGKGELASVPVDVSDVEGANYVRVSHVTPIVEGKVATRKALRFYKRIKAKGSDPSGFIVKETLKDIAKKMPYGTGVIYLTDSKGEIIAAMRIKKGRIKNGDLHKSQVRARGAKGRKVSLEDSLEDKVSLEE